MHPQIIRDKPGEKCPICGMPLAERKKGEGSAQGLPSGVLSRVQLTRLREQLAGVETAEVAYRPLVKEIRTVGFVEFDERKLRRISARVKGRIDKLYVNVTDQMVEPGQDLALLYSPDLIVPVQNLLDARRPEDKELVRTKLRLLGMDDDQIREIERNGKPVNHVRIRSPMHGHVIRKYAVEGDYVDEGARLYFVADLSTVWIEAQFYENELAFLRMGQKVRATTPAFPNRVFEGRVSFIHPHLDQTTRTLTIRFDVENPGHKLRPGMYATVQAEIPATVLEGVRESLRDDWLRQNSALTLTHSLFAPVLPSPALAMDTMIDAAGRQVLGRQDLGLAVPESAVIDTGSRKIVYRQVSAGIYEGVEVQLGPRCGDYYPVVGGLRVGERVATNGSFLIDADTRLNPAAGSTYFGASGGPRETASAGGSSASKEEANVRMALAKLSAPDRRLAEAQRFCAVQSANRLGSMGPPVKIMIQDQTVFLCCAGCRQEAIDHPQQTLATVANLKSGKLPKVGTNPKEDMP